MGVFRALGLGIAIVILKLLVPEVVDGFSSALSAFFALATTLFMSVESAIN